MVGVFAIGLVVAFLTDETTGLKPGGYIVPGYLAISFYEPARLAATLLTVLGVILILTAANKVMLLYGNRRFAFALLTGCVLKLALATTLPLLGFAPVGLLIIGFVIPGLTGHACYRQGTLKTLASVALATSTTKLIAMAVIG
ncbi:MAG: poly-gamma-glutamate biosynthesis protein PgsC [Acidobacteria bacterium]|nr:MAG: poly-gamma-glutamate biosynthesis protein PgsC [Acidobacteriota bacterium]PIE90671.1 MAG: poly-gamma-glutamate biosynthesis protein PgsC [Acidobacteriota bacterium]